jgi:putative nucleotidyltransferase with HDIG domain
VSFVGKSSYGQDDDEAFAASVKTAGNVIVSSYLEENGSVVKPYASLLQSVAAVGFVNKIRDENSFVRYEYAVAREEEGIGYSFAVKTSLLYGDINAAEIRLLGMRLLLGNNYTIRLRPDGTFPIKYTSTKYNFNTISASKLFQDDFDPSLITNKLVMVGVSAKAANDIYLTPLGHMAGVVINGNIVENIISQNLIFPLPLWYNFILLFILAAISTYTAFRHSFLASLISALTLFCLIFILALVLYTRANTEIDLFGIILFIFFGFGASRLYISARAYLEKSNMLNRLIIDIDTGMYNVYYLLLKLQQQLEITKDPKDFPSLLFLSFMDKNNALAPLNEFAKKETINSLASIVKENTKPLKGTIVMLNDTEFGVMVLKCKKQQLLQQINVLYQQLRNVNILMMGGQKKIDMTLALGVCYGSDFKEKSADIMIYAAEEALAKAKGLPDPKIFIFDAEKEKISSVSIDRPLYATEGRLMDFVIEDIRQKNKQALSKIDELNSYINELKNSYMAVISSLIKALEEKDIYTAGHSERVATYAAALADKLNLSDSYKETLKKAAMLHDIGKIGIPDAILNKKGALNEEERTVVERHEMESARILEPTPFLKDAIPLILHHHEHYDGSGYPHGLSGERIPIGSRIISICDSFDAMTSGRPYNRPMNTEEAIATLKASEQKHFDPILTEKFIEVIREFYSARPV